MEREPNKLNHLHVSNLHMNNHHQHPNACGTSQTSHRLDQLCKVLWSSEWHFTTIILLKQTTNPRALEFTSTKFKCVFTLIIKTKN